MRLPRMTTRRWMVAVLAAGLLVGGAVGGVRLKRRRDEFLARAEKHTIMEYRHKKLANLDRSRAMNMGAVESEPDLITPQAPLKADLLRSAADHARLGAHYESLTRKYQHAARYPWLSVEPDPPEPD